MKLLIEHNPKPGTEYKDVLLEDAILLNDMILEEDVETKARKFMGKLQEADKPNQNKRVYPKHILDKTIAQFADTINNGGIVGELDHANDAVVHLKDASHVIKRLWWEGNDLMGEGIILDTPQGRVMKTLLDNGIRVGLSSRGVGNGKVDDDGNLVVGESYKMVAFDAVSQPSTRQAYAKQIIESVQLDSNDELLEEIKSLKDEIDLIKKSNDVEFWKPKSKPTRDIKINNKSFLERIRS
jgi:hypothetical protein